MYFVGQASSADEAAQHAVRLSTQGTAPSYALTSSAASVYQSWLTKATFEYVQSMTAAIGSDASLDAAVNVLELGLFGSVLASDVTVLNATVASGITALLNVNSSSTQNYAYNVTLQVAVLTADMLLSVFVDVLNATNSRRRLLHSSHEHSADKPQAQALLLLRQPAGAESLASTNPTSAVEDNLSMAAVTEFGFAGAAPPGSKHAHKQVLMPSTAATAANESFKSQVYQAALLQS